MPTSAAAALLGRPCGSLSRMAAQRATGAPGIRASHGEPVGAASRETRGVPGNATHVEPPDRTVSALAGAQHGVVTRDQLLVAGLSRHAIAHRVAKGHLHRLHLGVYAVGHRSLSARGRDLAAVLACGPDAVLSHRSAAVLWGLLRASEHAVHVTAPTHRRTPTGVHLHFSLTSQFVHHDAIAVTTPARTIIDLAAAAPREELERALEEARLQRLLTDNELRRGTRGRPGARALHELLAREPSFTRSEAERRLLSLLRRARLPRPQTNIRVVGHRVDALWLHQRLVVEVDGFAFHSTRAAFERDRLRDADLLAAGYRVIRITWRRLTQAPEAVVASLAVALS